MTSVTTQKCSLCGEFKLNQYFATGHDRCGECETNISVYETKLLWRETLNEEENALRLRESSLR